MPSIEYSPTPNPNSMKFTSSAGPFIDTPMESFSSPDEAREHDLGRALFAIEHVRNVFVMPQFLTVTKSEEGHWNEILPAVEAVLERHFESER